MRRSIGQIIGFLISALLMGGLLTFTVPQFAINVKAEGNKTIAGVGTYGMSNPTAPESRNSLWKGNYVWYGKYNGNPIKYRILDKDASEFGSNTLFLDCDEILYKAKFDNDLTPNVEGGLCSDWTISDVRTGLNGSDFINKDGVFSETEKESIATSVVAAHELSDYRFSSTHSISLKTKYGYYVPLNEKIFLLDAEDVCTSRYGYWMPDCVEIVECPITTKRFNGNPYYWFLRSRGAVDYEPNALGRTVGNLYYNGFLTGTFVTNSFGVSPAFNVKKSSILYCSTITDKTDEFKLTLINNNIVVSSGEISRSDNSIFIPFSITGDSDRLSLLILDSPWSKGYSGGYMYYELLSTDSSGTVSYTLPSELSDKACGSDYYAYLIAEDVNGTYETDYASSPKSIDIPYLVKFQANGGKGSMASQSRLINDGVALIENAFTKEGYTFKNWNTKTDGKGVSYADKTTNNIAANNGEIITLYAQWDINKYIVTWVDEDGTVLETDADVEYGTIPTFDGEKPVKTNTDEKVYVFAGWTPAVTAVTGDVTYTATYGEEGAVYTITFDANGGTVTPITATTNAEFKLDSLPIPTYEGYRFKGWFTAAEGGAQITADSVFVSNQTIYAQWEKEGGDSEDSQNIGDPNTDTNESEEPDNQENPDLPKDPLNPDLPQEPELEANEDESQDYLDELRTNIAIAISVGGEQTVYWNKGDALPYDILKKLEDNPNITVVFEYSYQGEDYKVSISGKDVKPYTNILWYGPLYLYSLYGIDVTNFQSRGTYVVQEGDTLTDLANRFNTSVKSLVALNQIKDSNLIYVGQSLRY